MPEQEPTKFTRHPGRLEQAVRIGKSSNGQGSQQDLINSLTNIRGLSKPIVHQALSHWEEGSILRFDAQTPGSSTLKFLEQITQALNMPGSFYRLLVSAQFYTEAFTDLHPQDISEQHLDALLSFPSYEQVLEQAQRLYQSAPEAIKNRYAGNDQELGRVFTWLRGNTSADQVARRMSTNQNKLSQIERDDLVAPRSGGEAFVDAFMEAVTINPTMQPEIRSLLIAVISYKAFIFNNFGKVDAKDTKRREAIKMILDQILPYAEFKQQYDNILTTFGQRP